MLPLPVLSVMLPLSFLSVMQSLSFLSVMLSLSVLSVMLPSQFFQSSIQNRPIFTKRFSSSVAQSQVLKMEVVTRGSYVLTGSQVAVVS